MRTDDEEFARPAQPPDTMSWSAMREAAKDCEACHLYKRATQTVFGEGPKSATMMLVGEQPGDYEDVARSEEHTSELQSLTNLVCRLLLEKKKKKLKAY